MRCVDVNVLVYAHRLDSPDHARYAAWLDDARRSDEPLGVPTLVLSGFVRVVTHPRVFVDPTPLANALEFATALRASPAHVAVEPGRHHWDLFARLCSLSGARGNVVPDAYLAALALERGATWWTADRGFGRFPDLRWHHPLES